MLLDSLTINVLLHLHNTYAVAPESACSSSVAFTAISQRAVSQVLCSQLNATIHSPVSDGSNYFGISSTNSLFLLRLDVLDARGLLPFGNDYGGVEYAFTYSSSSYYGLQYTLPKPLPFFDKDHSILYINARGFISIGEPYLNPWSITPFPLTGDVPMVAAFWWWYYTRVHIHSYQQGSSEFDDAVIRVVGDRLRQFNSVNSTFRPETVVSITWSLVSANLSLKCLRMYSQLFQSISCWSIDMDAQYFLFEKL